MTIQIAIVLLLTFLIHLISTLSYSVRIVGTRTRKIAISFALFNIMVLVSRTSNSFQAPLLAKWVENNINQNLTAGTFEFRLVLIAATVASIVGAFLIPTFQRVFFRAVMNFSIHKSISKLILHGFTKTGISMIKNELSLPKKENLEISRQSSFPIKVFIFNIIAVAILTVGVLSSLYAGFIVPELRTTASSLSAIVNGFATIIMFIIIDPYLSVLTDEVVEGKFGEGAFRETIRYMVFARILGTIAAQFLLIPFAHFIAFVAEVL